MYVDKVFIKEKSSELRLDKEVIMGNVKNYAMAGCGHRGMYMFALPLAEGFKESAKLVAVCDKNPARAAYMAKRCGDIPHYIDFDAMCKECKIDCIIVATTDNTHDYYIIKALHAGYDVISEKPMTIDDAKCRSILKAEKETGKHVTVTFNVRFIPYVQRVRELIAAGEIGDVLSVHLEYLLDTSHGADYFRRWHRRMENSGGLLVHKSTHHFDMVNWLIDQQPEEVFAYGSTKFYGPTREKRGVRCTGCLYAKNCEFYFDLSADPDHKDLYINCESEDAYYRDRCVFDEEITTYDTMSVNVRYNKGAYLTYSLIAHSPYEGYRVHINGKKGRIEAESYVNALHPVDSIEQIRLYNRKGETVVYHIPPSEGWHGGSDTRLQKALFEPGFEDSLKQMASSFDGAMSILIGVAANKSIAENRPVYIADLLKEESEKH